MSGITNGVLANGGQVAEIMSTRVDLGGITPAEASWRGRQRRKIDDAEVVTAIRRVRETGVLRLLRTWRIEDGWNPIGNQTKLNAEAVLVAFVLLAGENSPLHIRQAAALLHFRLSDEMHVLLDLPRRATFYQSHAIASKSWEERVRSTLRRHILDPMDPFPAERYRSKTWEQIQRMVEDHDDELEAKRRSRLDEFMKCFLVMTYNQQPREIRRAARRIDLTIDQTPIVPPTKKGFSRKYLGEKVAREQKAVAGGRALTPGPVDPFAGFYAKSGERADVTPGKGAKDESAPRDATKSTEWTWAWALNLAVRVDADMPKVERAPKIVMAATLSIPNIGVSEEAVTLMRNSLIDGLLAGGVAADKAYFANARPERLHEPTRLLGFLPSTDYRVERVGQPRHGVGGVQFIDGMEMCPGTPGHLNSVVRDYRNGSIDKATFDTRRGERRLFQVHVHEKANDRGKYRVSCPAAGKSPTVTCPVRELLDEKAKKQQPKVADKARPRVDDEDAPDFAADICSKHAVTLDVKDNIRDEQMFEFGSDEWDRFHEHARQSMESANDGVKDDSIEDAGSASRRAVRGFAAAAFFLTLLLVTYNLRKIAAFLHDRAIAQARGAQPDGERSTRRRDRVWYNPYTKTTPSGLLAPEYVEARASTKREKAKSGALPART